MGPPKNQMLSWNERNKKRYAEDAEYRKSVQERNRCFYAAHKAEINERRRHKYATDPEFRAKSLANSAKDRRANQLNRYGMSLLEYELRLVFQNGACAICKKKSKGILCVDHCHVTGKVRGLLCKKCNSALGFCDDDPIRMQAGAGQLPAFYQSPQPKTHPILSPHQHTQ